MKKLVSSVSFLLLLLAATPPAAAQQTDFGLKLGLASSTAGPLPTPSADERRTGVVAGVFIRQALGQHLSLQPELAYEQRGLKTTAQGTLGFEGSFGGYERRETTRLQYLALPVLLRGQLGKFFVLAGPQISFLLAARQQATTEYYLSPSIPRIALPYAPVENKGTSTFNRWEPGYVVGAGCQLTSRLALEARFVAGLSGIQEPEPGFDNPARFFNPLVTASNRTWQAQVSYQLSK